VSYHVPTLCQGKLVTAFLGLKTMSVTRKHTGKPLHHVCCPRQKRQVNGEIFFLPLSIKAENMSPQLVFLFLIKLPLLCKRHTEAYQSVPDLTSILKPSNTPVRSTISKSTSIQA
jgi:hypothetical protein